jgi:hypothetical protein
VRASAQRRKAQKAGDATRNPGTRIDMALEAKTAKSSADLQESNEQREQRMQPE